MNNDGETVRPKSKVSMPLQGQIKSYPQTYPQIAQPLDLTSGPFEIDLDLVSKDTCSGPV